MIFRKNISKLFIWAICMIICFACTFRELKKELTGDFTINTAEDIKPDYRAD